VVFSVKVREQDQQAYFCRPRGSKPLRLVAGSWQDGQGGMGRRLYSTPSLPRLLLKYLSNAKLREQITAATNKVEADNGFAKWLNFGGHGVIDTIDPVEQEKHLRYNHLVANAAAIQNVIDLTRAVRELQADGYAVRRENLAQLSPYQTRRLKRFGDYILSMGRPDPFETDLVVPFLLEEAQESAASQAV
jgi:Tn3 transposase DDE domain